MEQKCTELSTCSELVSSGQHKTHSFLAPKLQCPTGLATPSTAPLLSQQVTKIPNWRSQGNNLSAPQEKIPVCLCAAVLCAMHQHQPSVLYVHTLCLNFSSFIYLSVIVLQQRSSAAMMSKVNMLMILLQLLSLRKS